MIKEKKNLKNEDNQRQYPRISDPHDTELRDYELELGYEPADDEESYVFFAKKKLLLSL